MILSNLSKAILPVNKFAIQTRGPKRQKWHRNREIWHMIFFRMNIKLSPSMRTLRQIKKHTFQKADLESYA